MGALAIRHLEPARAALHGRDLRLLPAHRRAAVEEADAHPAQAGAGVGARRPAGDAEPRRSRLQGSRQHRNVVSGTAADRARQAARARRTGRGRRRHRGRVRRAGDGRGAGGPSRPRVPRPQRARGRAAPVPDAVGDVVPARAAPARADPAADGAAQERGGAGGSTGRRRGVAPRGDTTGRHRRRRAPDPPARDRRALPCRRAAGGRSLAAGLPPAPARQRARALRQGGGERRSMAGAALVGRAARDRLDAGVDGNRVGRGRARERAESRPPPSSRRPRRSCAPRAGRPGASSSRRRSIAISGWCCGRARRCDAQSSAGESEGEFRARLAHLARERRDREVEELRRRYAPKMAALAGEGPSRARAGRARAVSGRPRAARHRDLDRRHHRRRAVRPQARERHQRHSGGLGVARSRTRVPGERGRGAGRARSRDRARGPHPHRERPRARPGGARAIARSGRARARANRARAAQDRHRGRQPGAAVDAVARRRNGRRRAPVRS